MKVFVVTEEWQYDGAEVLKVFSSKEKALEFEENYVTRGFGEIVIEEREVE